ncbi:PD-(D/E)XK nuclease superfamily protein [Ruminobacter amylophilus]|uniref:PD-(D/E)XK nuclease superfamily protein n=1 Tax=Ruminobacter amylophilus TaxID=867 RepID=A0A662ZJ78_9GAMM|nr:AAA family ATPase [Ruminobacter amylophilus]SFP63312.1 PD-(D/E)XK nuclease superfamily protein [Ruminobacter amylophilus]
MGSILNPDKENSFIRLANRENKYLFVDKTDFIEKTNKRLNEDNRFFAVTRPRRFGKTVTAHMLSAYYSKGYAGQNIFDNLKITNNEFKASYEKHLNKYDVIYIDMNTIDGLFDGYSNKKQKVDGVNDLVDYFEYSIIKELKSSSEFSECLEKHQIENTGLLETLLAITQDLNTKFIFIMDEWDLVYREYCNDEVLQKKFIKLLKNLFKADGGQVCFALAYLTGILPIKKYNSQSALNGFDEYNMLSPGDYAPYFGFTEDEVANIVKSPNCKVSHQDLKEWYEGYKIKGVDIYNPNSVCKAVTRNECISYWSGTSSNEEFVRLINMDFDGIKEDIINLIEGDEVTFSCANFQNDMVTIKDKNDVFSLLVCLGYLGCSETKNQYRKVAYVPNAEIKAVLMDIVREQNWYERMETIRRSENLLKAIRELDGTTVATIIQDIHNSSVVSLLDYNDEESLTYCVMTGLLWSTLDDYSYHREDQAGKGRVDLVYEPITRRQPLILIEFKYDDSAEEAIKQIKEKEYFKRYAGQYRNIILVGINYSTKTKDHQCLIEKLD